MNRINRKVEYALMALKFMSGKYAGQLTTVKEICDATGSPFDATARVMQVMVHHKLLQSEQGAHGGYLLIKDLNKVSFFELVEMILGPLGITKCLHSSECDLIETCNVLPTVSVLNNRLAEFYKSLTLAELLQLDQREVKSTPQATNQGEVLEEVKPQ
ncbi:MAG: Rrf2 family transcriptional regulator [Pseudobdellovibrionaceae bacterium]|nr:Rrf2 family transcriptional regulator [Bdellovibrionales bacterium]USN46990.1 MAG: Rrf2 family transcriptional regulator [Pseudobdellovibrionaceae bacterium]